MKITILTAALLAVTLLAGCGRTCAPILESMSQVNTTLISDCRKLAQESVSLGKETWTLRDPLPASIKSFAPQYVQVHVTPESTVVDIQLSGGFLHRGLLIVCSRRDPSFTPTKGRNWLITKLSDDVYEYRENADSITGAQYFELTPTQVNENRRMANEGDAEAAFRLYQHYAFGVADEGTGAHWLRKASDLGNKKAKQHLDVEAATEKSRKADGCTGAPTKDPFE